METILIVHQALDNLLRANIGAVSCLLSSLIWLSVRGVEVDDSLSLLEVIIVMLLSGSASLLLSWLLHPLLIVGCLVGLYSTRNKLVVGKSSQLQP